MSDSRSKHRDQLKTLLISKFMNKYFIKDAETDCRNAINKGVNEMLSAGAATEAQLAALDRKLETVIRNSRSRKEGPSQRESLSAA